MNIISWNVNGVRAIMKKDFESSLKIMSPDIICLQETKAQDDQVQQALFGIENYYIYSFSAIKKGYSGTAILTKKEPISVKNGLGIKEHDNEGRVITAEFDEFFLITVYTPNSGGELKRLPYRKKWDIAFYNFLKELEQKKAIIVCGDLNVAQRDIDLARPKPNYNKSAGYMQEEIDGIDRYTKNGIVDTFRYIYPDKAEEYSWWSYRGGARERNVGWRIDYFLTSQSLLPKLKNANIYQNILGSDHCPVGIEIDSNVK